MILNDYFNYGNGTKYFIEAILKYGGNALNFTMGYKLYSADNTNGIYPEAGYNINDKISLFIGGITNASFLNFADDKGITNIGIRASKELMITDSFIFPLEISLIVNPNYKNISKVPGVGQNSVNFVVSVVF